LKELTADDAIRDIETSRNDILFISSPNYEKRSIAPFEHLLMKCDLTQRRGTLQIHLITLQALMSKNVVLEKIKWSHVEAAQDLLKEHEQPGYTWQQHTVTYPQDFYYGRLYTLVNSWIVSLTAPVTVYLDISGLPRRVILGFLTAMSKLAAESAISRVVALYAWPQGYPEVGRPANVGTLTVGLDAESLHLLCQGLSQIVGVTIVGREGYGATLFANTLPQNARLDTYVFMSKNDPIGSLRTIYSNSAFLSQISGANYTPHYFLSVSRGHRLLIDHAEDVVEEWRHLKQGRGQGYFVAALGPKPMLISAFVATRIIEASKQSFEKNPNRNNRRSGVVLVSGHQYTDLYSLGFSHISCYELDLNELVNSHGDS
jgi:hypothetical protein